MNNEKITLTEEMIIGEKTQQELGMQLIDELPYSKCEEFAMELAEKSIIMSGSGVVFRSYKRGAWMAFLQLKYFSNIDVTDWGFEPGFSKLVDLVYRSYPNLMDIPVFQRAYPHIREIENDIYTSIKTKHEYEHSLMYKLNLIASDGVFSEHRIREYSKNPELGNKLIDAIARLSNSENKKEISPNEISFSMFAKK